LYPAACESLVDRVLSNVHVRELFLLDPEIVFLNHGSFGACPRPVFAEYQRLQLELEREPVEFLGLKRRFPELIGAARERLAAYVGASGSDLVLVPNAKTAVNTVARSLDLQPGDEIVATTHEYGGNDLLWRYTCERRGARYVEVNTTPASAVDQLLGAVTPRTRALFFSHISPPTALRFPAEELCAQAREAGVLSIVDGAHAPGQIGLDLASLGADFYAGNCHKWRAHMGHTARTVKTAPMPLIDQLGAGSGTHAPGSRDGRGERDQRYDKRLDHPKQPERAGVGVPPARAELRLHGVSAHVEVEELAPLVMPWEVAEQRMMALREGQRNPFHLPGLKLLDLADRALLGRLGLALGREVARKLPGLDHNELVGELACVANDERDLARVGLGGRHGKDVPLDHRKLDRRRRLGGKGGGWNKHYHCGQHRRGRHSEFDPHWMLPLSPVGESLLAAHHSGHQGKP
jgi:hypothetical protein